MLKTIIEINDDGKGKWARALADAVMASATQLAKETTANLVLQSFLNQFEGEQPAIHSAVERWLREFIPSVCKNHLDTLRTHVKRIVEELCTSSAMRADMKKRVLTHAEDNLLRNEEIRDLVANAESTAVNAARDDLWNKGHEAFQRALKEALAKFNSEDGQIAKWIRNFVTEQLRRMARDH